MEQKRGGLWCYSLNGDYYIGTFDSVEATLAAGQKEAICQIANGEKVDFIYVANAEAQHDYLFLPNSSDSIEYMADQSDYICWLESRWNSQLLNHQF